MLHGPQLLLPAAVAEPQQRQQLLRLLSPQPHAGGSPSLTAVLSNSTPLHPSLLAEIQGGKLCYVMSQPLSAELLPCVPAADSERLYYYYYWRVLLLHCPYQVHVCLSQRV
jgi:hypothetical protein